ncbi:DNA cytosine methyltransferase [Rhizobium ruizarguesonis]
MKCTFIDLFAGCGGLSLGLIEAGWQGIFAVEKSTDAFATLKHNLVNGSFVRPFAWPVELPCEAITTQSLIDNHRPYLQSLAGSIDLIAGGPPCQGFSFAGRRNESDPRNQLIRQYSEIVEMIKPRYLLLENVKGFATAFKSPGEDAPKPYSWILKELIQSLGYVVYRKTINASRFGVPQPRPRFIMIAVRNDIDPGVRPFGLLERVIEPFRISKGLPAEGEITVKEAISDLEINGTQLVPSVDTKGFSQIRYASRRLTPYQKLMRDHMPTGFSPNSLRLPNHGEETTARFKRILTRYPKGKSLPKADLEALGTKKHSLTPLHADRLSKTITTLPDDLLHYSEPRILTVRENARIQSFPDWFDFLGKYTTGGARRKDECPRYSQVGNAVPPLMAEALGRAIMQLDHSDE